MRKATSEWHEMDLRGRAYHVRLSDEVSRQHPDALIVLTDSSLLGLGNMIVARAMTRLYHR
jgi:hypothetical protein